MSKYQFHESDIYIPGTSIPVNKLGITDEATLAATEADLLGQAYEIFVAELDINQIFDAAYFLSLHQRTFESLYEWAGQYRSVDMLKGQSMFCRAIYLRTELERIFKQLADEKYLREVSQSTDEFAERLAYFQSELIALHPFYELNGRVTRLFFDLIAICHGYAPIDYDSALTNDPEVGNNYIRASIDCVQRADSKALKKLILAGLHKR